MVFEGRGTAASMGSAVCYHRPQPLTLGLGITIKLCLYKTIMGVSKVLGPETQDSC